MKFQFPIRSIWRRFPCLSMLSLVVIAPLGSRLAAPAAWARPAKKETPQWPKLQAPETIKALQYLLLAREFHVVVDGKFGAQTRREVANFQRSRGLKADGVVGAQTWKALVVPVKKGDHGNFVRAAQYLVGNYLGSGEIAVNPTGSFDANTEKGIKTFQKDYGLKADGLVGPTTWRWLLASSKPDWWD